MKKLALTLYGLCAALVLASQNCGTNAPEFQVTISYEKDQYLSNKGTSRRNFRRALEGRYAVFTLKFILIREEQTVETLLGIDIEHAVNRINNQFSGAAISFTENGNPLEVENNRLAYFNTADECLLPGAQYIGRSIRVIIVDEIIDGAADLDGYTFVPDKTLDSCQQDFIVLTRDALLDGSTFAHELGHFFGLLHTHHNFDNGKRELVNGDRCKELGDGICDTPADPNLYTLVHDGVYVGQRLDPNNQPYQSLVDNIMSYAPIHLRTGFTPGQHYQIAQYARFKRQYLIAKTTMEKGATAPSANLAFNLAGAFEQYKLGGPDKVLFFVHKDSFKWSAQQAVELAALLDHNSRYTNFIQRGNSQFSLVIYDADQPDRLIPDFIGNNLYHQPDDEESEEYRTISMWLRHDMIQYPAFFILHFKTKEVFDYAIMEYFPGYLKPREIRTMLQKYTTPDYVNFRDYSK